MAGRGIVLALAALMAAGCDSSANQPASGASPAEAARASATQPLPQPEASPVEAATVPPTLSVPEAERAFADAVRAVVRGIGGLDGPDVMPLPDSVFSPLREAGLVGESFDGEADYSAWSRPRKPLRFLGHSVAVVIAEDMRAGFIGCCVDQGVTLYLHKDGDIAALQQFAQGMGCNITPASEDFNFERVADARRPLDADDLLALNCHERDINR
jgi:hypothetical protein